VALDVAPIRLETMGATAAAIGDVVRWIAAFQDIDSHHLVRMRTAPL
jgi:hypothetical protein